MKSGQLYSLVTKYWPRIAAGLVVVIGLLEIAVDGMTADSGVEFYLMAWAGLTGGVWFLFEKAERALSTDSRQRVVALLNADRSTERIESIPDQFAVLFDRVFGERHLTIGCLLRSTVASVVAVAVLVTIWIGFTWPKTLCRSTWSGGSFVDYCGPIEVASVVVASEHLDVTGLLFGSGAVFALTLLFNAIPDYVSLAETRACLRLGQRRGRLARIVVLDLCLTALISSGLMFGAAWAGFGYSPISDNPQTVAGDCARCEGAVRISGAPLAAFQTLSLKPTVGSLTIPIVERKFIPVGDHEPLGRWAWPGGWDDDPLRPSPSGLPPGLFFYSAFATSVWLWLYAASVLLSRVLLKMNDGVGFLLRVTDVENQPFRSMGFVCVLIVSGLFLLGLPLVLL